MCAWIHITRPPPTSKGLFSPAEKTVVTTKVTRLHSQWRSDISRSGFSRTFDLQNEPQLIRSFHVKRGVYLT